MTYGTVTNPTGIAKARRLAKQADQAERQAEAYKAMADAIRALNIDEETKRLEVARYDQLTTEMYDAADDLRGQVDPELIDYL